MIVYGKSTLTQQSDGHGLTAIGFNSSGLAISWRRRAPGVYVDLPDRGSRPSTHRWRILAGHYNFVVMPGFEVTTI